MAFKSKTSTVTLPSDVVFEPHSELKTEEGTTTLILHIPDFKKDQLRVQVNNQGVLKVSGEKPPGEDGKRKSRFHKETKIPQGCDINDIRAKFIAGQLHVVMPIKDPSLPVNQEPPSTTPLAPPQSQIAQSPKPNTSVSDEQKPKGSSSESGTPGMISSKDESKDSVFGIGDVIARLQVQKKAAVNWGVALVALVAIGAYVAYTYDSSSSSSSTSSPPSHIED